MSTTLLKFIALFFMLIDHIAEFIPRMPEWFRMIGRMSAPIFIFCMAWGFHYTHNRKKYLIRMYLCGVAMGFTNVLLYIFFHNEIENNIFLTLFLSAFLIYLIDNYKERKNTGKIILSLFVIWQIVNTLLLVVFDSMSYYLFKVSSIIFANIFLTEGGIFFVILGVLLYYTKHDKKKLLRTYLAFSIIYTILYATNLVPRIRFFSEINFSGVLYNIVNVTFGLLQTPYVPIYGAKFYTITNFYWIVIFALPFMLIYNGKKGKGYKYFFYIFYPLHIYVLYFVGHYLHI